MNGNDKRGLFTLMMLTTLLGVRAHGAPEELSLWYRQPATAFEETLVLGNGRLGASVFGGTAVDSIYLNDATLWTGTPSECRSKNGYQVVPLIRAALDEERYDVAEARQHFLQGSYSESYAPLGTLILTSAPGTQPPTEYRRERSLERAVAKKRLSADGITYARAYFT